MYGSQAGKRGGAKRVPQGGGKREKLCNIMQLKGAKRRELTKIGQEPGKNYTRRGMLWTPVSPLPHLIKSLTLLLNN